MKKRTIVISKRILPLKANIWDAGSDETLIYVGGSADTKDTVIELVENLLIKNVDRNIVTFSFRGYEEKDYQPLQQQVIDLMEILNWTINNLSSKIILVATSMGVYSTVFAVTNSEYNQNNIQKAIFIDPADYYTSGSNIVCLCNTWSGCEKFAPTKEIASDLLKGDLCNLKVDVVNFTIRNYTKDGYVDEKFRGTDNPKCFKRLNAEMVKRFYFNVEVKNRGKYLEVNNIPHAFVRDGNVKENIKNLASILVRILL